MSRGKLLMVGMMVALLLSVGAGVANAQGGGGGGGGGGGRRGGGAGGGGGNFDPAAFQAQREQRMKDALGVTDDEWKVLQPRIQKVTQAQMDARGGMFGGRGGRGGPGGGGANGGGGGAAATDQPQSAVAKATAELRTLLDNKDAAAADIKAKLTALRDARDKAKKDLVAAQAALKEVCNARQEAYFALTGMLE